MTFILQKYILDRIKKDMELWKIEMDDKIKEINDIKERIEERTIRMEKRIKLLKKILR